MKSFAVAALVAVAAAQYEQAPPSYNTTSVEVPVYSTPAASSVPEYSATTTVECEGPTEIPVGPSYTFTYTGSESTTLTITYPAETPSGYESAPAPSAPAYPTSNGTVPVPSYPAGTGSPSTPAGTGSYTAGTPVPTEFPGAAGKTGLSLLAVVGALAAFL